MVWYGMVWYIVLYRILGHMYYDVMSYYSSSVLHCARYSQRCLVVLGSGGHTAEMSRGQGDPNPNPSKKALPQVWSGTPLHVECLLPCQGDALRVRVPFFASEIRILWGSAVGGVSGWWIYKMMNNHLILSHTIIRI